MKHLLQKNGFSYCGVICFSYGGKVANVDRFKAYVSRDIDITQGFTDAKDKWYENTVPNMASSDRLTALQELK